MVRSKADLKAKFDREGPEWAQSVIDKKLFSDSRDINTLKSIISEHNQQLEDERQERAELREDELLGLAKDAKRESQKANRLAACALTLTILVIVKEIIAG